MRNAPSVAVFLFRGARTFLRLNKSEPITIMRLRQHQQVIIIEKEKCIFNIFRQAKLKILSTRVRTKRKKKDCLEII